MPANTPTGRVNLSPAASRMLAKMTDGAWFLTFSRKAAASISAAHELHAAGLAVLSGHHNGELRVALPVLTLDNHEWASVILNTTHPDWGTKRFTRDPSVHGHHTHGTGSNSAVLRPAPGGRDRRVHRVRAGGAREPVAAAARHAHPAGPAGEPAEGEGVVMHMTPITRHEHYLEMRGFTNSDGEPHFTAMDCLSIAYGPGHARRRRAWERQSTRTIRWSADAGLDVTVAAKADALNTLQQVRR